jgi:hypothetical protein
VTTTASFDPLKLSGQGKIFWGFEVIRVTEFKFDHSFCIICSILSPAVFEQSSFLFYKAFRFRQSGAGSLG